MARGKAKFITAVTTPSGQRFEKKGYVRQIPTGGVGQIVEFQDEGAALVQVQCAGGFFIGMTTIEYLIPLTEEEAKALSGGDQDDSTTEDADTGEGASVSDSEGHGEGGVEGVQG